MLHKASTFRKKKKKKPQKADCNTIILNYKVILTMLFIVYNEISHISTKGTLKKRMKKRKKNFVTVMGIPVQ